MIKFEFAHDKEVYHKLWDKCKLSFMQSWAWGEFKSNNNEIIRIICFFNDDQSFPITLHCKKFPLFRNKKFAYVPKFASDEIYSFLDNEFWKELMKFIKTELGLTFVIIEPNLTYVSQNSGETSHFELNEKTAKYVEHMKMIGFHKGKKSIQPNETDIIDLLDDENAMLDKMSKDKRYEIRKAIKNGCEIEICYYKDDNEYLESVVKRFYEIMKSIYSRTDYVMYGIEYFRQAFAVLGRDNLCKILFVKQSGEDVGAMMHYMDNETSYEIYGGVNEVGRKFSANYFLKWEGMKYAMSIGKISFDQWGVAPKFAIKSELENEQKNIYKFDSSHQLFHISKFKEGFGGKYIEFAGQWIYVYSPIWFFIYKIGILFNSFVVRLRKFRH